MANNSAQPVKVDKVVDTRRIYINSYNSLNKFKRILFDDSDYFSYSDILFLSQSFGEKIRIQDYQFRDFSTADVRTREKYTHNGFEQWVDLSFKGKCMLLKDCFNMPLDLFYGKMINEKIVRYRKICQNYQKYRFLMSSMNNSTISDSIQVDHLEWIKVKDFRW